MSEELINKMVDRFLSWELPETICPDGGLSLDKDTPKEPGWWPTGTNMLSATEAKAMVLHMLGDDLRAVVAPAEPFAYAIQNKSHAFLTWPDPEQGNHHILAYKADPDYTVTELYTRAALSDTGEDAKSVFDFDGDKRPAKGLWAPGNYSCRCFDCGTEYIGYKRSKQCADCAYKPDPTAAVVGSMVEPVAYVQKRDVWHGVYDEYTTEKPDGFCYALYSEAAIQHLQSQIAEAFRSGQASIIDGGKERIYDLERQLSEAREKTQEILDESGQQCGCAYDAPSDICLGHKRLIDSLRAEVKQAGAKALREFSKLMRDVAQRNKNLSTAGGVEFAADEAELAARLQEEG